MKWLISYWVIGCIIVGPGLSASLVNCGRVPSAERVAAIAAIWPALLVGAVMLPKDYKLGGQSKCSQ